MAKEKVGVVKIDSSLLCEVEETIGKEENRLRFANKKQFIDIAVNEFLQKIKNESNKQKK
jgi:hypothetical protein